MRRVWVPFIVAALTAACAPRGGGEPAAPAQRQGAAFPGVERPVAETVSPEFSRGSERDAADESGQVVRLTNIAAGETVADVGAGAGYHTLRLSRVVGAQGLVIAVDVVPEYLNGLRETVRVQGLQNVEFVLGSFDDPRLPRNSIDAAVLAHMYHEVQQPYAFLWNLAPAMRPGGRVAVIDVDRPIERHGISPDVMRCEFEAVGYRRTGFHVLQGNVGYLAIFEPPTRLPDPSEIRSCRQGSTAASR